MLSLCAITKGRGRARERGSGRGLTEVPSLLYGLLNSRGKKCCLYYIGAGFDGCQRPPCGCLLQHMQQEPSQVMLGVLDVTNSRNDFVTCCNEVVHLFLDQSTSYRSFPMHGILLWRLGVKDHQLTSCSQQAGVCLCVCVCVCSCTAVYSVTCSANMVNLHKVHGFSYTLLCPVSTSRVVVMQKDHCDCCCRSDRKAGTSSLSHHNMDNRG